MLVAAIAVTSGRTVLFLTVFISAALHELAHVLAAIAFGRKVEAVTILPIGFMADMPDLEPLRFWRKLLVYAAGPGINVIIAIFANNPEITAINIAMAAFNLLPIYPLDGGRITLVILSRHFGIMQGAAMIRRVNVTAAKLFMAMGLIQFILFPPNISVLLIAYYLLRTARANSVNLSLRLYKALVLDKSKPVNLPIRLTKASPNSTPQDLFARINWDNYTIFVAHTPESVVLITENDVVDMIASAQYNENTAR